MPVGCCVISLLLKNENAADSLKKWFGTWSALGAVGLMIIIWIGVQSLGGPKLDVYPFILLNLILSCFAAMQGAIILLAAKRADAISSEVAVHTKDNTDELMAMNRRQLEVLQKLDGLDGKVADLAETVGTVLAARTTRAAKTLAKPKDAP